MGDGDGVDLLNSGHLRVDGGRDKPFLQPITEGCEGRGGEKPEEARNGVNRDDLQALQLLSG